MSPTPSNKIGDALESKAAQVRRIRAQLQAVSTHQNESEQIQPRLSNLERFVLGTSGGSLVLYGVRRRDTVGIFFLSIGAGAIIRAFTNMNTPKLFELVFHPRVKLERIIQIDAPIDVVFDFWKNFSNYSRFMSYVHDVKVNDRLGFTWSMIGPAGIPIQWDSQVSALSRNQLIAWKSLPGALIMNSGRVSFRSKNSYKTQIEIILTYSPPAGSLGYELIRIFGFDPRTRIDGDLLIMKALIEQEYARSSHLQKAIHV